MKSIIAVVILLILIVVAIGSQVGATTTCPEGSYQIDYENDQPICKLNPTGCPYGDSIPLGAECDKHKPTEAAPASTLPTTNPVPDTELPEFEGKQ